MPEEVRYILFSPEEVLHAVVAHGDPAWHLRGAESGLPSLELFATAVGDVAARILRPHRASAVEQQEPGQTDLLAALLSGCRAMRILLPRRGHKALELMGDHLALTVMLNTD
ncbi:hypothetical protein [Roseicella aerolata]|uniref:Uncharacterized protein n=1 Tax=Roseicella aerolata TaxID=2883479 RepID=A0A9X1IA03_9PROT|nr:hypothetical protein [Roseicella aerolata]MCB4821001.1 hypothetical protein [Roseicella aerolata]